jgi:hypothetical protein
MIAAMLLVVIVLLLWIEWQVLGIEGSLHRIIHKENRNMAKIEDVLLELRELPTIDASLDALFALLAPLVEAGKTDAAKLDEALALITTHKDAVKADIVANTPAQP